MRVFHEQDHHLEGLARKPDGAVPAPKLPGPLVQGQVLKLDHVGDEGFPPSQHGPHPGQQLLDVKGLGQVVVRPGVQAGHPVLHGVPGSQKQAGGFDSLCPHLAQGFHAVLSRHHPVQDHAVIGLGPDVIEGFLPVQHGVHLIAGPGQQGLDRVVQVPVVFRQQNPQCASLVSVVIFHDYFLEQLQEKPAGCRCAPGRRPGSAGRPPCPAGSPGRSADRRPPCPRCAPGSAESL